MKNLILLATLLFGANHAFAENYKNLMTCDNGNISIDYRTSIYAAGMYDFQMVLRNNTVSYLNQNRNLSFQENDQGEILLGVRVGGSVTDVWNNKEFFNASVGGMGRFAGRPYYFTFYSSNTLVVREGVDGATVATYHFNHCYKLN